MKSRLQSLLIIPLLLALLQLAGCTIGGIFGTNGRQVIYEAAKPYVEGCQQLEVGPLYKLSNESTAEAPVNLEHELGVLVGGCGTLVQLLCDLTPQPGQTEKCSPLALWKLQPGAEVASPGGE